MTEVLRKLKENEKEIEECPFPAQSLGELVAMIKTGEISSKIAKAVFEDMWAEGKAPAAIVKDKGLVQVSDPSAIEGAIRKVLQAAPDKVAEYRSGKEKLFGFFVGQVMKETQGKANPAMLNDLVKVFLKGERE
jgi:aspartyl-tRNA(Asn)/glutamyl-tRNA(Gln) amidotransferase subunit B